MRESVGSLFIFKIMIFFIFFFASFLAISINYSQAFRIKNQIINILEQQEGWNDDAKARIDATRESYGYYRVVNCHCSNISCTGSGDSGLNTRMQDGIRITDNSRGICIKKQETNNGGYYKVTTYVSFNFPIIGNLISVPVSGETKVITNLKE